MIISNCFNFNILFSIVQRGLSCAQRKWSISSYLSVFTLYPFWGDSLFNVLIWKSQSSGKVADAHAGVPRSNRHSFFLFFSFQYYFYFKIFLSFLNIGRISRKTGSTIDLLYNYYLLLATFIHDNQWTNQFEVEARHYFTES
jgi:hypothetical protein